MDILIKTEDRTEVDNLTKLIKNMSESEQQKILIFLQGVKFAEALTPRKQKESAWYDREKRGERMSKRKKPDIEVKITFTPGYEKRFTAAILKIFEARERQKNKNIKEVG